MKPGIIDHSDDVAWLYAKLENGIQAVGAERVRILREMGRIIDENQIHLQSDVSREAIAEHRRAVGFLETCGQAAHHLKLSMDAIDFESEQQGAIQKDSQSCEETWERLVAECLFDFFDGLHNG